MLSDGLTNEECFFFLKKKHFLREVGKTAVLIFWGQNRSSFITIFLKGEEGFTKTLGWGGRDVG